MASSPAFPSTRWSRLAARPETASTAGRADLEHLAKAYWRPICAWLRVRWGLGEDAAEERSQQFFVWMLERDFVAKADRSRGRFRGLVKAALANWMVDQARHERAAKRGGGAVEAVLGAGPGEIEPAVQETPDAALDAAWRRELVANALSALEAELSAAGHAASFAVFEAYFVAPVEGVDYRALAERFGCTVHDVSNHLQRAKRKYRARLRQLVMETVASEAALEEELRWLFGEGGQS